MEYLAKTKKKTLAMRQKTITLTNVRNCQSSFRGGELVGNKLFDEVKELSGLPDEVGGELQALLDKRGLAREQMTLEQLREMLSEYLVEVNRQMEASDALSAAFHATVRSTKAPTQ